MSESQRLESWSNAWAKGIAPWHSNSPHHYLVEYYNDLTANLGDKPGRFFLPLCGKAGDLVWLYEKGHTVIGVEGVKSAVEDFFKENNIQFKTSLILNGQGSKFESLDGRVIIFACDFFDITKDLIGDLDCVFDRGSLVAIYPEDRVSYAAKMNEILDKVGTWKYLLASYDYDQSQFSGPPRSVPIKEVHSLFDEYFQVKLLAEFDDSENGKKKFGIEKFTREIVMMSPKC